MTEAAGLWEAIFSRFHSDFITLTDWIRAPLLKVQYLIKQIYRTLHSGRSGVNERQKSPLRDLKPDLIQSSLRSSGDSISVTTCAVTSKKKKVKTLISCPGKKHRFLTYHTKISQYLKMIRIYVEPKQTEQIQFIFGC